MLLTVMSEGEIAVPRLGRVPAAPGFSLVAAMNPYDAVGTARISSALYDRTCRIAMGYQSEDAEQQIVALRSPDPDPEWRDRMVRPGAATPASTPTSGSAPRCAARSTGSAWPSSWPACAAYPSRLARRAGRRAKVALSGRIRLHESSSRTPEEVVTELYE